MRATSELIGENLKVDHAHSNIHSILRELVEMIEVSGQTRDLWERQGGGELVLLDIEVDGARYLLVRMAKQGRERLQLSPREHEIVRMVAKGHPNKVIADVLNISSWTVCTHLRRIFAKMGVASRAAMVAQLLERGVVSNENRMPAMRRHDS